MNDLLNKVITVSAKEEKLAGGKPVMKIKDEKGLTYSVWKFKQDGTESVAWGQIPDLNTATQIGYVEDVKQDPQHGTVTYRTIRNFNPDLVNTQDRGELPLKTPNNASQGIPNANYKSLNDKVETSNEFWDKKAYKQCLWNYWLKNSANTLTAGELQLVWDVFNQIEQDADKRFATGMEKARAIFKTVEEPLPEELPTIHVEQDINVDDIPF